MKKKIIPIALLTVLAITGCASKENVTENEGDTNHFDTVTVGEMKIEYNKEVNAVSYSNWTDSENPVTILYNSQVYDIDAEHMNDQRIDFPCISIGYDDTEFSDEQQIIEKYDSLGRLDIKIDKTGNYYIVISKKKDFNDKADLVYVYIDLIPADKGTAYEITCSKGNDTLKDSLKTYNYYYSPDETAYNSVSQAVDKFVNSNNTLSSYSEISSMLDEMSGSLSEYKGDSSFVSSGKSTELQVIGEDGMVSNGKEAEKLEDSDLPDITPEEEIIKQETLDITDVSDEIAEKGITYDLTEKDQYIVGEDIESGIYRIINNSTVQYNANGEIVLDTLQTGSLTVIQPDNNKNTEAYSDIEETDSIEETDTDIAGETICTYEITEDDPEGYESINALTLFDGQIVRIDNLNITLEFMGAFES